jgi:hypothetical protein
MAPPRALALRGGRARQGHGQGRPDGVYRKACRQYSGLANGFRVSSHALVTPRLITHKFGPTNSDAENVRFLMRSPISANDPKRTFPGGREQA